MSHHFILYHVLLGQQYSTAGQNSGVTISSRPMQERGDYQHWRVIQKKVSITLLEHKRTYRSLSLIINWMVSYQETPMGAVAAWSEKFEKSNFVLFAITISIHPLASKKIPHWQNHWWVVRLYWSKWLREWGNLVEECRHPQKVSTLQRKKINLGFCAGGWGLC